MQNQNKCIIFDVLKQNNMTTTYIFNEQKFYSFADLCNAYYQAKGYYPTLNSWSFKSKDNMIICYGK